MDPHDRRRDAVTARPASPSPDAAVTAWLAATEHRFDTDSASRMDRMVKGYEALLTQARRWDDEAKALRERGSDFHDVRGVHLSVRAEALTDMAGELRELIALSLLGEDGTDV